MRKVYLIMMVSVDGFFEGEDHDISWHNVDDEFNQFAIEQLDNNGTLLFGHRTYDLMASYWPTAEARDDDQSVATRMNELPKVVFSHTNFTADWDNTEVSTDVAGKIAELKQQPGKDIAVFGSSNLCVSLLQEGLLDEVRLIINPLALGKGTTLFAGLEKPVKFELTATRRFASGNVLNTYKVV